MLEQIKQFLELTKIREKITVPSKSDPPVSHVRVFHKDYPRFERIELPDETADPRLEELWRARRSTREFLPNPLAIKDVAAVLRSCRIIGERNGTERRSYPSGGARFPVELYLLAFRVEGLETGCYHYELKNERLEVLWPANLAERTEEIVSPFVADPAAALVMTSVISRSEVKYGVRALPFSLIEAGHMAQNIQLACAARSLGCCPVSGFVDDTISSLLDLTEGEIPLYVTALGNVA